MPPGLLLVSLVSEVLSLGEFISGVGIVAVSFGLVDERDCVGADERPVDGDGVLKILGGKGCDINSVCGSGDDGPGE